MSVWFAISFAIHVVFVNWQSYFLLSVLPFYDQFVGCVCSGIDILILCLLYIENTFFRLSFVRTLF